MPEPPDYGRPQGEGPADDDVDKVLDEVTVGIDVPDIEPNKRVKETSLLLDLVKEDVVRAAVAILLLILLAGIVIWACFQTKTWKDAKELLDLLLPAVIALLGSAVGFYFGTKVK